METREQTFEIRKVDPEARTFTGIAAPYLKPASIGGTYMEQFARGAFGPVDGVKVFDQHREVIGHLRSGQDTDDGFEVTGYISDTARGNDIRTMMQDGTLDRLSVGFIPVEHTKDDETGTVTRTKVDLKEVSVVPFPAYDAAQVSQVRGESNSANNNTTKEVSKETIMENTENTYDDSELRATVDNLTRELAVVRENGVVTHSESESEYRSAGEMAAALLKGDAKAIEEARDVVVSSTAGHASNDWRGGTIEVINRGRPLVQMFEQNSVAQGHKTFEFLKGLVTSGAVAVQSSEGATIANLSATISTDTGTLQTFAGYVEATFQATDFSDVDIVGAAFRAAVASYAKVTNDRLRTVLAAATPQTGPSITLSSATGADWLDTLTYSAYLLDQNATFDENRQADFAIASLDVFRSMSKATDSNGRPLFAGNNGSQAVNSLGSANQLGLSLSLNGLTVVLDPGLSTSAKSLTVASKGAVGSWEKAGSPFDLQGITIVNLKRQFATYGYYEAKVKDNNALVKANIS